MSNIEHNDDDEYTGPAWYRPGKNRDLFLGLLLIGLLVGFGGLLSQCDAGADIAERFGFDTDDGVEEVLEVEDDGGDDEEIEPVEEEAPAPTTTAPEVELPDPDVRGALDSASFNDIGEEVNGSTAVLTGVVASQALKDQAGEEAAAVEGIEDVDNQIVVEEPEVEEPDPITTTTAAPVAADPFAVTGSVSDGVLTLTGAVPSEQVRTDMVEAAAAELGADSVIDELTVDEALGDEGTLTLTGEADADVADAIVQAAGSAADESGADVDNQLQINDVEPPTDLPSSLNEVLRAQPILFEVNSAVILPESLPIVDEVAQILNDNPDGNLIVEGHTDSDGDDGLNLQLSQNRADSVRAALIERNVAADRLSAIGRGEDEPVLVDGAEDKDLSRRIEFVLPEE